MLLAAAIAAGEACADERTDNAFTEWLASVFAEAWAEPVTFHNPLQDKPFTQTVYLARKA